MHRTTKDSIARFIKRECIYYPSDDEYFFGKLPGARYSRQYYLSNLLYNQECLNWVVEEFKHIVETEIGHWQFQITGREWSAIPLLIGIPAYLKPFGIHLNSFMIRSSRKTYGRHNIFEGVPNKLPVLIVDDLCNSTDSFTFCNRMCRSQELNLDVLPFIFAVLNKYRYEHFKEETPELFDRYLGRDFKALSIVNGDDVEKC